MRHPQLALQRRSKMKKITAVAWFLCITFFVVPITFTGADVPPVVRNEGSVSYEYEVTVFDELDLTALSIGILTPGADTPMLNLVVGKDVEVNTPSANDQSNYHAKLDYAKITGFFREEEAVAIVIEHGTISEHFNGEEEEVDILINARLVAFTIGGEEPILVKDVILKYKAGELQLFRAKLSPAPSARKITTMGKIKSE